MLSHMPELADPWRLIDLRKRFSGELAQKVFPRLMEVAEQSDSAVEYVLNFDKDGDSHAIVEGEVKTVLNLACQRCFEPVAVTVESSFVLGLVTTEAEAERLPESLDPVVVGEEPIKLQDWLEDELLLSIPQFPMHEPDQCHAEFKAEAPSFEDDDGIKPDNPFAALAALKETK